MILLTASFQLSVLSMRKDLLHLQYLPSSISSFIILMRGVETVLSIWYLRLCLISGLGAFLDKSL